MGRSGCRWETWEEENSRRVTAQKKISVSVSLSKLVSGVCFGVDDVVVVEGDGEIHAFCLMKAWTTCYGPRTTDYHLAYFHYSLSRRPTPRSFDP